MLEKLIAGLHKFQENIVAGDREFFESLSRGQAPHALFVACSDSRVNPNLITQTDLGELFVLRNAGGLIPPYGAGNGGAAATIEYAVQVLKVRHIVVCGHSHCGALSAMADNMPLDHLPALADWLKYAQPTMRLIEVNYGHLNKEQRLMATVQENVLVQLSNLRTHPCVEQGIAEGNLQLHGWVYRIDTGRVFCYDARSEQFVLLSDQLA